MFLFIILGEFQSTTDGFHSLVYENLDFNTFYHYWNEVLYKEHENIFPKVMYLLFVCNMPNIIDIKWF